METDATLTSLVLQFFGEPDSCLLLALYLTPTILAILNRSAAWAACFFVNLLFGWTFIGWIVAIVLAAGPNKAQIARRKEILQAKANFYLREEAKHAAN